MTIPRCPILLAALLIVATLAGCGTSTSDTPSASIAVSSPYLEAAICDLLGDEAALLELASPGMCPGHFDLRPSQIEQLQACRLLVRFDFQLSLDRRVSGRLGETLKVVPITVSHGLCNPASYEEACRALADALVADEMLTDAEAQQRLTEISARMKSLRQWVDGQVAEARLADTPVVASRHQRAFCEMLGLRVVGELGAADTTRASMLDEAVSAGEQAQVRWIIANRPEGRRLADVVADRLGAQVVMFENLPTPGQPDAFDELVRLNVRRLVEQTAQAKDVGP